jgi:hypothetical protein
MVPLLRDPPGKVLTAEEQWQEDGLEQVVELKGARAQSAKERPLAV